MPWHSVSEFFAMGGYAPYVWGSIGACALAMLAEPWLLRRQHRQIVRTLQRQRRVWRTAAVDSTVIVIRGQAA